MTVITSRRPIVIIATAENEQAETLRYALSLATWCEVDAGTVEEMFPIIERRRRPTVVIYTDGRGDTESILAGIRKAAPRAQIVAVATEPITDLADRFPWANAVLQQSGGIRAIIDVTRLMSYRDPPKRGRPA
jgi:hypothetical protein